MKSWHWQERLLQSCSALLANFELCTELQQHAELLMHHAFQDGCNELGTSHEHHVKTSPHYVAASCEAAHRQGSELALDFKLCNKNCS